MKSAKIVAVATMLAIASVSGMALANGHTHQAGDAKCAKECEMALKDCAQGIDSLQQKIAKLSAAIKKEKGAEKRLENVRRLETKLAEAQALLKSLEKPGR